MTTHLDPCLIDVSEEDDSLLPIGDEATHRNLDDLNTAGMTGYTECKAEGNAVTKGKLPVSHASLSTPEELVNLSLPVLSEDPNKQKKKKKPGFNVRKSMAWNDAFLTEEGVLDCEELRIVNKTFQKPSGPPKQTNLRKITPASKLLRPPMMPKISLASHRVERKEDLMIPALSSRRGSMEKFSEPQATENIGPDGLKLNDDTSLSLGTMPSAKKEIPDTSAKAESSGLKPSLLCGAIDKKDQAPKFITSKGGTQLKHAVKYSRSPIANLEASRRSFTKATMERLSSTTTMEAQPAHGLLKLHSGPPSSSKMQSVLKKSPHLEESGASTTSNKPSGLRMPSPKLGFFDTSRSGSQVAVLHEKTNGRGYGGSGPGGSMRDQSVAEVSGSRSSKRPVGHSATSAKFGYQLPQASRNQYRGIENAIKISRETQVHGCYEVFASLQAAPSLERSASLLSSAATDTTEGVLQVRKIGQNSAIRGKPDVRAHPATFRAKGQENLSPKGIDGIGMPCPTAPSQPLRKPAIKASGNICASGSKTCEDHTENILSAAQNSASQFVSSSVCAPVEQQYERQSSEGKQTW